MSVTLSMDAGTLQQSYLRDGYLLMPNLIDRLDIGHAIEAINEILQTDDLASVAELEPGADRVARRIWSPTKVHSQFVKLAEDSRILDVVESLIGPDILFHYSKLHLKAAQHGSPVEWHQDFSYYPHTNTGLLTALVYLDDADEDNGCLQVMRGSHLNGLDDHYVDGSFRGKIPAPASQEQAQEIVSLGASAGSVIFLHCLTKHASASNRSGRPRRAFLPAYRAADAYPIYYGPHASHNEPGVKLLRGNRSRYTRVQAGDWIVPLAAAKFGSLFELQEGSHLSKKITSVGYATTE